MGPRIFFSSVVIVLTAGCAEGPAPAPVVGAPAPAYATTTLAGDSISLERLRGDVVLLNVWATWCAPCRKEIPALQRLHAAHSDEGLRVVGVSIDAPGEEEGIRSFLSEFGVTYPIWYDEEAAVADVFQTIGVPSTFLIDREGEILWKHVGPVDDADPELSRLIREALDEAS